MTNLFFEKIQIPDITPDLKQKNPAAEGQARFIITTFIVALLILLTVGAACFAKTGQGGQSDAPAQGDSAKAAPLDLFP